MTPNYPNSDAQVLDIQLPQEHEPESVSGGFYRAVEKLWSRRRILLRWVVAGALIGGVLAILLPAKYESTTRVLPSDTTSTTAMMMASSGAAGAAMPNLSVISDLLGMKTPGALCAALLRSDTVMDGVIDRLDLRKVYSIKDYEKTRRNLADRTVISEDKKSTIVTVTVTDYKPERAAAIVNAYADELDKVLQSLNTSSAHREREFLEQRIQVARGDLTDAEKALGDYASRNSTLDVKEQGKAAVEVAGKVEGELIAAQSELRGLRQIYGPDHPRVKSQEARIAQLRATAEKLTASGGETDMQLLSISRLPVVGVTYADLLREVKVQEAIYETLLKEYEVSKVEEAKETPRLRVIDKGKIPLHRSGPRRSVLIILGILLGFLCGYLFVRVTAWWSSTNADDPRKRLIKQISRDLHVQPRNNQ